MRCLLYIIVAFMGLLPVEKAHGQHRIIKGIVYDAADKTPLDGATVSLTLKGNSVIGALTDSAGYFSLEVLTTGKYELKIAYTGFIIYNHILTAKDSFPLKIFLHPDSKLLGEVKIIHKSGFIVQNRDTTEYDASAFKVQSSADAYDMVKKMPGMEFSGKNIKAQGEAVTKLLIDGKPFFSNDPYIALKNFPAAVIRSIQVYNEGRDQEQFTGFKEGAGTTTINIITKPDKKRGRFGKLTAGIGNGSVYGINGNVNFFDSNKRFTTILQSNNNSTQNFTDANAYESSRGGGNNGIFNTNDIALNYAGKLNTRMEVSGNIFVNTMISKLQHELWRQYTLVADSGRKYQENGLTENSSHNYRLNSKLNYTIDTANSLVLQPTLVILNSKNSASLMAVTTENELPVNQLNNQTLQSGAIWSLSNDLLYKHKFRKSGHTFSLNISNRIRKNEQANTLSAKNIVFDTTIQNDNIDQQSPSLQSSLELSANAAYTVPLDKKNTLQFQYRINHEENSTAKYVYDRSHAQNITDSQLSSAFNNVELNHKAGADYKYRSGKLIFSTGVYGQLSDFSNQIFFPSSSMIHYRFQNILPVANLQFGFKPGANLQVAYNTATATPSFNQLQNSINNTNQLYLQQGNPDLRQTYRHHLSIHYKYSNAVKHSNLDIHAGAANVKHYISNEVIIASNDTLIGTIRLYKGGQLLRPVNIEGYYTFNAGINYTWPLKALKSNLAFTLNGSCSRIPAIINSINNHSLRRSLAFAINLNSNISEHLDYTFTTNTSYSSSTNTLNTAYTNRYLSQDAALTVNITLFKNYVFNTDLFYQYNSGIAAAADRTYLVCNLSVGRKLFKQKQGSIRLCFYDILNQNKNVSYIITDTYISSSRSTALQRYATLSFTLSFNKFSPTTTPARSIP